MSLGSRFLLILLIILGLLLPAPFAFGQEEGLAFTVVGTDPVGDAVNQIVPGVDVDALVTADRTDIIGLSFAQDEDDLHVKLHILTLPAGTGGYMYRVAFENEGTLYYTCFAVQWTGGQLAEENLLGCSRFAAGDQVGPATTSAGVVLDSGSFEHEDGAIGGAYVLWPVSLGAIGGSVEALEGVFAETWFRGVSDCCVGSTTHSQYLWNLADVAPDEGTWDYAPPTPSVLPDLVLGADANETLVAPGSVASFNVSAAPEAPLDANETAAITLDVFGLDDWEYTIEPEEAQLDAGNETAGFIVGVQVPETAWEQTVTFNVTACYSDGLGCGNLTLSFTVQTGSGDGPSSDSVSAADGDGASAGGNETVGDGAEEGFLPAPAPVFVLLLLGLWAMVARRRST